MGGRLEQVRDFTKEALKEYVVSVWGREKKGDVCAGSWLKDEWSHGRLGFTQAVRDAV